MEQKRSASSIKLSTHRPGPVSYTHLTASEMETLAPELDFEPRMALEAPENGLAFYRHIAPAYFSKLSPGGALVFEIGWQQGQAVAEICRQAGYTNVKLVQDLEGRDRCVRARRP